MAEEQFNWEEVNIEGTPVVDVPAYFVRNVSQSSVPNLALISPLLGSKSKSTGAESLFNLATIFLSGPSQITPSTKYCLVPDVPFKLSLISSAPVEVQKIKAILSVNDSLKQGVISAVMENNFKLASDILKLMV